MWKFTLKLDDGQTADVGLRRGPGGDTYLFRTEQGEVEFRVDETEGGGVLRIADRVVPFVAARSRDHVDVWLAGRTFRFTQVKKAGRGGRDAGALATDEIVAPMPGSVLKINVASGESFAAHAPLLILESMKMELALSAPAAGVVGEVLCRPGELVQMGQVLIRLASTEADGAS